METIKEEKKAEGNEIISVGQLMKSLIERGWLPRGDKEIVRAVYDVRHKMIGLYEDDGKEYLELVSKKSLRELVSTDSGLWQFVCENDYWVHKDTYFAEKYTDHTAIHLYQCNDYRYWLLGSALTNEDELEDFLLQNIKIDE